jgi:hypothetical protein
MPTGRKEKGANAEEDDDDEVFATELPDMNRTCRDPLTMSRYQLFTLR